LDSYTQLIQMGVRWYDAQIGRWISADTIIPDLANPQSLDRFAYVLGNPLRYVDPTGHMTEYNCADGYCRGRASGSSAMAVDQDPEAMTIMEHAIESVDRRLWEEPNGFGVGGEVSAGYSVVHGQKLSAQGVLVGNWRSGELTAAWSWGGGDQVTIPKGSLDGTLALLFPFGYSRNEVMLSPSKDRAWWLQIEKFGKFGLEAGLSEEVFEDPKTGELKPFMDEVSNMQPGIASLGASGGWQFPSNPLGFDVGHSWGASRTFLMVTWKFYPWTWTEEDIILPPMILIPATVDYDPSQLPPAIQ
jgi:RHS repeat-associated protein